MIIFRILVWLNPIIPLISILIIIINVKNNGWLIFNIRIIIGAIFCHVNKIRQVSQDKPSITSTNQKWKGAAPIFVKSAELNIMVKLFEIALEKKKLFDNIIIENKINVEAKAWVIKYFKEASEENRFLCLFIRGIIDRRLISKPNHIPIQERDEIEINDPIIIEVKNNIL